LDSYAEDEDSDSERIELIAFGFANDVPSRIQNYVEIFFQTHEQGISREFLFNYSGF
jgi:hypothetical protein